MLFDDEIERIEAYTKVFPSDTVEPAIVLLSFLFSSYPNQSYLPLLKLCYCPPTTLQIFYFIFLRKIDKWKLYHKVKLCRKSLSLLWIHHFIFVFEKLKWYIKSNIHSIKFVKNSTKYAPQHQQSKNYKSQTHKILKYPWIKTIFFWYESTLRLIFQLIWKVEKNLHQDKHYSLLFI